MVARAALEEHHIAADEACAMVGDGLHRLLHQGRLRREAGDDRIHQDAGAYSGIDELTHGAEALPWMRGAGLELSPYILVHAGHADVDAASGARGEVGEHVLVADDHRSLRHDAGGIADLAQRFERSARELVVTLDGLVAVRRGPDGDVVARP